MVRLVGGVAAFVGLTLRWVVQLVLTLWRGLPLVLVVYGVQLYDVRAAWVVAGVLLFLYTRPTERRKK